MEVSGQLNSLALVPLGKPCPLPTEWEAACNLGLAGCFQELKDVLLLPGIEPWLLGCPSCGLVTVDTAVLAALCTTFINMLTVYIWRFHGEYHTPEYSSYISHSLIPFNYISCMFECSKWAGDISLNVAEHHIVLWWKNLLNVVDYLPIRRCYSRLGRYEDRIGYILPLHGETLLLLLLVLE
jgi:hypothetical protein